jgi:hypothetical protein
MARTRTISGDDVKAADEGGFALYTDGDYIGQIIDVKEAPYAKQGANAGKPALNVTIRIIESSTGEGVGKKFIAWQVPDFDKFASGSNAWLYFQFYKALGVVFPKAGESEDVDLPELIDIIDQEIGFHLTIQEASGNYKAKNQVSRFFPASDGIEAVDAPPSKDDEAFTL